MQGIVGFIKNLLLEYIPKEKEEPKGRPESRASDLEEAEIEAELD